MKKIIVVLVIIVILAVIGVAVFYYSEKNAMAEINSFEECLEHGFLVRESHPRQCQTPDDRLFVEILDDDTHPEIRIFRPESGDTISSPLTVLGEARGPWFFEASFSVELLDADGEEVPIDPPYIMTSEDWMTEDFVPFNASLNFSAPQTESGTLIFHKANPSGLPERDDSIEIPIVFETFNNDENVALGECRPTGCSGEICSDQEVSSICIWQEEFACYQDAVCERQSDGECGWTETEELSTCLAEFQ